MSIFEILDIAIVLIVIYLTASLFASEIQEEIASILEFRAKSLKQSIQILLGDETLDFDKSFWGKQPISWEAVILLAIMLFLPALLEGSIWLLIIPAIFLLVAVPYNITHKTEASSFISDFYKCSYIKSSNQYTTASFANFLRGFSGGRSEGPSYLTKEYFVNAIFEFLHQNNPGDDAIAQTDGIQGVIDKLANLKQKLPEEQKSHIKVHERLIEIAKSVKTRKDSATTGDFRLELKQIFEASQERISGVYRRNSKGLSLLIGAVLAYSINIDTLHIVRILQDSPELRSEFNSIAVQISSEENNSAYRVCLEKEDGSTESCLMELSDSISQQLENASSTVDIGQLIGRSDSSGYSDDGQALLTASKSATVALEIEFPRTDSANQSATADFKIQLGNSIVSDESLGSLQLSGTQELIKDSTTIGPFRLSSDGDYTQFEANELSKSLNSAVVEFVLDLDLSDLDDIDTDAVDQQEERNPSRQVKVTIYLIPQDVADLDSSTLILSADIPVERNIEDDKIIFSSKGTERIAFVESDSHNKEDNSNSNFLNKFLGWAITAVAISMGAPFWFDLLGRVLNVRNAGKAIAPQNTQNEN